MEAPVEFGSRGKAQVVTDGVPKESLIMLAKALRSIKGVKRAVVREDGIYMRLIPGVHELHAKVVRAVTRFFSGLPPLGKRRRRHSGAAYCNRPPRPSAMPAISARRY